MISRTQRALRVNARPPASAVDSPLVSALHIFTLWAFAVAQPVFQVLASDPNFFVVRGARGAEILALVLFIAVVAPLPLAILSRLSAAGGRGVHGLVHGGLVAALLTLMAAIPLHEWSRVPVAVPLLCAALLGLAGSWLYFRSAALRGYATWLTAAVLVFPGLFVANPGVRKLIRPAPASSGGQVAASTSIPLVLVVFDELPVVSLLDDRGGIDPIRYPNFAALASQATWYPNATASADYTQTSVPAILTGRYPRKGQLPIVEDHPQNVFTWLAGSHDLQVLETFTELCPRSVCQRGDRPLLARLRDQILDLGVVYLHVVLPEPMTRKLPSVVQNWQGVDRPTEAPHPADSVWGDIGAGDRGDQFLGFVRGITFGERPPLVFLHSALPHAPWNHLPSGTRYPNVGEPAWAPLDHWSPDPAALSEAYLRHLLQLEFVDKLLGRLVERLRAIELYEPAMLVVTSDHGMSFEAGGSRRGLSLRTVEDILSVPLLIKAPFQTEGAREARRFEAIELVETMADGLGVELPWTTDAASTRSSAPGAVQEIQAYRTYPGELASVPTALLDKAPSLERKLELFGSGDRPLLPTRPTRLARLIGRSTDTFEIAPPSDVRLELSLPPKALIVGEDLAEVPARLSGSAARTGGGKEPFLLAVSVNGVLQAVTRVGVRRKGRSGAFWSAFVKEESFAPGANRIEFFLMELPPTGPRLRPARAVFDGSP